MKYMEMDSKTLLRVALFFAIVVISIVFSPFRFRMSETGKMASTFCDAAMTKSSLSEVEKLYIEVRGAGSVYSVKQDKSEAVFTFVDSPSGPHYLCIIEFSAEKPKGKELVSSG